MATVKFQLVLLPQMRVFGDLMIVMVLVMLLVMMLMLMKMMLKLITCLQERHTKAAAERSQKCRFWKTCSRSRSRSRWTR